MDPRGAQPPRRQQPHQSQLRLTSARGLAFVSLLAAVAIVIAIVVGSMSHSSSHASSDAAKHARTAGGPSTPRPAAAAVPILAYAVINTQPAGSSLAPDLYVPASEFTAQMNALKANGWHAVTLNQLADNWTHGTSLGPGKPIVITFDTGYASQYANALPVLKGLGWVGVENLQVNGLPPSEGGLTDAQVRGLIAAGWELNAAGVSQPDLTVLGPGDLRNEVTGGRQTLRSRYGVPVNWFAYPAGRYNPTVVAAVQAAGFLGAMTLVPGWASPSGDHLRLPRMRVVGGTSPSMLLSQIASAQHDPSPPGTSQGP